MREKLGISVLLDRYGIDLTGSAVSPGVATAVMSLALSFDLVFFCVFWKIFKSIISKCCDKKDDARRKKVDSMQKSVSKSREGPPSSSGKKSRKSK